MDAQVNLTVLFPPLDVMLTLVAFCVGPRCDTLSLCDAPAATLPLAGETAAPALALACQVSADPPVLRRVTGGYDTCEPEQVTVVVWSGLVTRCGAAVTVAPGETETVECEVILL